MDRWIGVDSTEMDRQGQVERRARLGFNRLRPARDAACRTLSPKNCYHHRPHAPSTHLAPTHTRAAAAKLRPKPPQAAYGLPTVGPYRRRYHVLCRLHHLTRPEGQA